MLCLCVIICFLNGVLSQTPGIGKCPQPRVKAKFDLKKYQGDWFELRHSIPNIYELYGKCTKVNYKLDEFGFLISTNEMYSELNRFHQQMIGNATIDTANCEKGSQCGKLKIAFPSAYANKVISPYWVLGTDYKSFATIWSCLEYDSYHFQYVWILGKEEHPAASVVKAAMRILKINGLDDIPMADTNQNNCPLKG
ncbi:hypothetical protein G9C98_005940 [Cotesia typhae]|uniref:Lipocalin/cytosolic fatty-acid binding domain-containing protein n=1 Tax=Cotesia typhae TaxID=2053667 RepID=A0A8J5V880_9HYME|nr:hypothetical protein G9C98_005940 [Cotesia typhae]